MKQWLSELLNNLIQYLPNTKFSIVITLLVITMIIAMFNSPIAILTALITLAIIGE